MVNIETRGVPTEMWTRYFINSKQISLSEPNYLVQWKK
jgi:hypothetical protein